MQQHGYQHSHLKEIFITAHYIYISRVCCAPPSNRSTIRIKNEDNSINITHPANKQPD